MPGHKQKMELPSSGQTIRLHQTWLTDYLLTALTCILWRLQLATVVLIASLHHTLFIDTNLNAFFSAFFQHQPDSKHFTNTHSYMYVHEHTPSYGRYQMHLLEHTHKQTNMYVHCTHADTHLYIYRWISIDDFNFFSNIAYDRYWKNDLEESGKAETSTRWKMIVNVF